ncbi:MAG: hypothetical protein WCY82_03190 [Desulfotomaculaceae bacterium]
MQSTVLLYRLYDLADEINLETVEELLSVAKAATRLRLSRIPSKSIDIENPPVSVELGGGNIELAGVNYHVGYFARVYDLGVVSVMMRILLPREVNYELMQRIALDLEKESGYERHFSDRLDELKKTLAPALVGKESKKLEEDFTIFFFTRWQDDWDPLPLLLGEKGPFSDWVRRDTLHNTFSYSPEDMIIITWDSALVFDSSGSTDLPDLLEFALSQLLELRYYDGLLSAEMEKMYQELDLAARGRGFSRLRHYRRIMSRLMGLVAEVTDITERIHNSIKVTEDIYYARIYSVALTLFRTRAWMDSIQRKVAVIQQNYSMLSDEIVTARSTWLEVAIILLIALEIVLGLMHLLG